MNYFRIINYRIVLIYVYYSLILVKKKKNLKKNRGIKKDDVNKILENNIIVKLVII